MRRNFFILLLLVGVLIFGWGLPHSALAEPVTLVSPIHAGCYLAKLDRCKIHVEPFIINLTPGTHLDRVQIMAQRNGLGSPSVIYDFRPDISNPVPFVGSSYSPSLVAKDFAASCGSTYVVNLSGKDTGDTNLRILGNTGPFTCPTGTFLLNFPVIQNN